MAVHFVEAKNRKDAIRQLPITPCKMIKVYGGYAWFDTMKDYEMYKRAK